MKKRIILFFFAVLAFIPFFLGYSPEGLCGALYGNTKSGVFHNSSCRWYSCKNCTKRFDSVGDAESAGYRACMKCGKYNKSSSRKRISKKTRKKAKKAVRKVTGKISKKTGRKVTRKITLKNNKIVSYPGKGKEKSLAKKEKKNHLVTAELIDVIDGDTLKIFSSGKEKRICLYGVDSPELNQDYGETSKRLLASLVSGRNLNFKLYDENKHGMDRAVIFADSLNVNELLISNGATWYSSKSCHESFCGSWLLLQFGAQEQRKGLWSGSNPVEPWSWKSKMYF